eukprot:CAMPEP_0119148004 /NCGR_PEP_ID=MMETSP1310-20130426/41205_1 /TAXON_ID=464262 /ORGANISM="Genus nov. species nov., Strain RCC2339" /LENGTH=85 /DNA_ID=CAMNT_0007140007 /DNA_START=419 /DNA_END=672 /DNA_ORIENTATION=-
MTERWCAAVGRGDGRRGEPTEIWEERRDRRARSWLGGRWCRKVRGRCRGGATASTTACSSVAEARLGGGGRSPCASVRGGGADER